MKTLKLIFASTVIAASLLSVTAQADELMDIIHPESADLFHFDRTLRPSESTPVISLSDDKNSNKVWSYEYEEYVNPADFVANNSITNMSDVNRYMDENPSAAGKTSSDVFKWDATYDGYLLQ